MALLLLVLLDVLAIICPNCRWWTCCKTCSHCGQWAATSTGSGKGRWFGAVCHHRVCRRATPYKSLATATCTEKKSCDQTKYFSLANLGERTTPGRCCLILEIRQAKTVCWCSCSYAAPRWDYTAVAAVVGYRAALSLAACLTHGNSLSKMKYRHVFPIASCCTAE